MQYILPALPYGYSDLEPTIDANTLELHYTKHHASYIAGANNAMIGLQKSRTIGDFSYIKHLKKDLAFNLSGHILHSLYWQNMTNKKTKISSNLRDKINDVFGNMEIFEGEFKNAGITVEGSGWVLLVLKNDSEVEITIVEKHQNLFLAESKILLACDMWEHAYYLKYKNDRALYLENFWKIINWDIVSERMD